MRRFFAPAAVAAVAMSLALPAFAAIGDSPDSSDTSFDLGINVSSVPATPAATKAFVQAMSPEERQGIIGGCQNYVKHPEAAQSPETLPFCQALVG